MVIARGTRRSVTSPQHVPSLLRSALSEFEISRTTDEFARRTRRWAWPAVQMGLAASIAWALAHQIAGDAAGYAPITAIAALGLGRERRLGRSSLLVGGLLLGVVAAEIVTPIIGSGWWQIGVLMALSALAAGAVIGHELAVTYATINAVVLLTTPGSDGWIPSRLIAGLTGIGAALAVMLLVLPPRPVRLVSRRLRRAAQRASDALEETAGALRDSSTHDQPSSEEHGDGRRLLALARRLDDEIEQSHSTVDQACELVRWSPWRRRRADDVGRLADVAHDLRPALRTASTIARLGDRAVVNSVTASDALADEIGRAAAVVVELTDALIADDATDGTNADIGTDLSGLIDQVVAAPDDHAIVIALQEEIRGLLDDLADVVSDHVDGVEISVGYNSEQATGTGVSFGGGRG